jgi:hypothetical protein
MEKGQGIHALSGSCSIDPTNWPANPRQLGASVA